MGSPWSRLFPRLHDPQPFSMAGGSQPSGRFGGLLWTCLSRSVPVLCWGPRAGRGAPGGSVERGAAGEHPLPRPAGHTAGDVVQKTLGFLGCKRTLPAHVPVSTALTQHPAQSIPGVSPLANPPHISFSARAQTFTSAHQLQIAFRTAIKRSEGLKSSNGLSEAEQLVRINNSFIW